MPITKSAEKALRSSRRKANFNKQIRQRLKKVLKIAHNKPEVKAVAKATSLLDRAAKKRVIHPNKAARLKSQLAKKIKSSSS